MARSSGKNRSALDRRRESLQSRRAVADETGTKVKELDRALETNAVARRDSEAGLQAALDRVAGLKKAIKASKKQRDKLRTARDKARENDAKARQRASSAEQKYDRAVLEDMVRREKERDLASHTRAGKPDKRSGRSNGTPPALPAPPPRAATAGLPSPANTTSDTPAADEAARANAEATKDRASGKRTSSTTTSPRI
ncbi:MAG TPA: hypothetical protein VGH99_00910 [Pseudonocardia sp.]|jgi:chromosome segregation ATPase